MEEVARTTRYRVRFQETCVYEVEVTAAESMEELSDSEVFELLDDQNPNWFKENLTGVEDRTFLEVTKVT